MLTSMLTQQVDGGGDGPALKVTETIVRNVRVLATDQRIDDKDKDGKIEVKTFANVTFEVTPTIAEKIAVAQSLGTLSLSLRSIADNGVGAGARGRSRRCEGPGRRQRRPGEADAAGDRQPSDRQQHDLHRPVATCRASSAAPFRPSRKWRWALGGLGQAIGAPGPPRKFRAASASFAAISQLTLVRVGAR